MSYQEYFDFTNKFDIGGHVKQGNDFYIPTFGRKTFQGVLSDFNRIEIIRSINPENNK